MGILDAIFNKYFGPVFIKENSNAEEFVKKMKSLSTRASGKLKDKIEDQISAAEAGLYGERQIAYELRNSGMDMIVAHDLSLEKNDLSAQIDFLVVTRRHVFVIECKNLYGNIEIDDKGNFIRHIGKGKFYRREGLTSPVSQNARHLNVLREIRREYKTNFLTQALYEKAFPKIYRSVIVLANPKTVLNDRNAPEEIRKVVIRLDQLVSYIKRIEEADKDLYLCSRDEMHELIGSFLKCRKPVMSDYAKKFEALIADGKKDEYQSEVKTCAADAMPEKPAGTTVAERKCPRCGAPLVLRTSRKGENVGRQFWGCSAFPKCWYKELPRD